MGSRPARAEPAPDRLGGEGIAAEADMRRATGGVNTHRGVIFSLGSLCAAAGRRGRVTLGATVSMFRGSAMLDGSMPLRSRGAAARRLQGAGGARFHCCFALMAALEDTDLLHRGGGDGLAFARREAPARGVHRAFVARRLSSDGTADLLAMTLFAAAWEAP